MLTAEENRRTSASAPIRADIQEHIAWLRKRLKGIERELSQALRNSPLWREQENLLRSVPCIAPVVTVTLLADLPQLGILDPNHPDPPAPLPPLHHSIT